MKKLVSACAAAALLAPPAFAASDQAVIRLVAIVPVRCSMDVLGSSLQGHQLILDVHRTCNTSHELSLVGQNDQALGNVSVAVNGDAMSFGGSAAIYQPEAYYDRVDRIVIESSSGSQEDLLRFAATLQVNVTPV